MLALSTDCPGPRNWFLPVFGNTSGAICDGVMLAV